MIVMLVLGLSLIVWAVSMLARCPFIGNGVWPPGRASRHQLDSILDACVTTFDAIIGDLGKAVQFWLNEA